MKISPLKRSLASYVRFDPMADVGEDLTEANARGRMVRIADRMGEIAAVADRDKRELTDAETDKLFELGGNMVALREFAPESFDELVPSVPNGRKTEPEQPRGNGLGSLGGYRSEPANDSAPVAVTDRRYMAMFPQARRDSMGFANGGEFLEVLASGRFDPRLVKAVATTGDDGSGGYLVPSPLTAAILDASLALEVVRPRARVYGMAAKTLGVTGRDTVDRSDGVIAGIEGQWLGEAATGTRNVPAFAQVLLSASKLAMFASASVELIQDAPQFATELINIFGKATAYNLDKAFLFGSGSGQPKGVLHSSNAAVITVTPEVGQAASTITFANIRKMWGSLTPGSHRSAVWICAPDVVPELLVLSVNFSNAAGTDYVGGSLSPLVAQDANGALSILGRPVLVCEHCPPLGSKGDIALLDLDYYAVGMRWQFSIERNNAPGWLDYTEDFRGMLRVDGKPLIAGPVSIADPTGASPATVRILSPFVTLGIRDGGSP